MDANKKVHIVAQDPANGDLNYAYLGNHTNGAVTYSAKVDSYGSVGSQLTLDVGTANGKVIPYISYYAGSLPKLAYFPGGVAGMTNGVAGTDGNLFTGRWECSYVPTSSKVPEDRINVALKKNNDGEIEVIPSGSSSSNGTTGQCYGNGTANPVVGYVRKTTSAIYNVETAQKQ